MTPHLPTIHCETGNCAICNRAQPRGFVECSEFESVRISLFMRNGWREVSAEEVWEETWKRWAEAEYNKTQSGNLAEFFYKAA